MDSRFYLTVKFSIYGKDYEWKNASLNWFDNGDGIDQRIVDFFRQAHDEAYAEHQQAVYEADKDRREREQVEAEKKELARLTAKYHPTQEADK